MEDKYSIKNLIIIFVIIIAILVGFYFITFLITNNKSNKTTDEVTNESVIDYDTILVSDIYKQSESSYYVLVKYPGDEKTSNYESSLEKYGQKENAIHVYQIDISSAFNKKFIANETDLTQNIPVFNKTTLLKIENGVITVNYQDTDIDTLLNVIIQ